MGVVEVVPQPLVAAAVEKLLLVQQLIHQVRQLDYGV